MRPSAPFRWFAAATSLSALLCLFFLLGSGYGGAHVSAPVMAALVLACAIVALPRGQRPSERRHEDPRLLYGTVPLALLLVSPPAALAAEIVGVAAGSGRLMLREPAHALRFAVGVCAVGAARLAFVLTSPSHGSTLQSADVVAAAGAGLVYFGTASALGTAVDRLRGPSAAPVARPTASQALLAGSAVLLAPLVVVAVQSSAILLPAVLLPVWMIAHYVQSRRRTESLLHDPVTGLPNRACFHLRFDVAKQAHAALAVMVVEVDADSVPPTPQEAWLLPCVAQRLESALRKGDAIARLDGNKFGVLTPLRSDEPREEAERLAQQILRTLRRPLEVQGEALRVQAWLGMGLAPLHGSSAELLMSRAERALQGAHFHRRRFRTWDPAAREITAERQRLIDELRSGLELDQLELRYQPKVDLRTNVVIGVEALARWRHPVRGLLGPAEFIPLAESEGLIEPLTLPVLDKALAQAAAWCARGWRLNVAVNLSARHLGDASLPRQIEHALARHGLPAELLTLEVTESTIMSDPAQAVRTLNRLRSAGVHIAIDDYGTGYSSLAFLRRLQVDELKIDASFIHDLVGDSGDEVIVRSTIELGHNLGLRVVAEGVEDLDAWRRLSSLQCDVVQGFLVSAPRSAEDLTAWLEERRVAGAEDAVLPRAGQPVADSAREPAPAAASKPVDDTPPELAAR